MNYLKMLSLVVGLFITQAGFGAAASAKAKSIKETSSKRFALLEDSKAKTVVIKRDGKVIKKVSASTCTLDVESLKTIKSLVVKIAEIEKNIANLRVQARANPSLEPILLAMIKGFENDIEMFTKEIMRQSARL